MQYFHIITYGCTANQNNSEILAGLLTQSNYLQTNNIEVADIIIINTCIVKQKTENKILRKIQDLSKQYPKKLIVIAGCMPETNKKQLQDLAPKLILLGTHHFKDIIKIINKKDNDYLNYKEEEKLLLPKIPLNKLISITQISEGCDGECSYCRARLAKGKLFSYDSDNIVKSIESDLNNGAKEVWLTSQDCASYGLDRGKQELPELIERILDLKHRFKLRLGMINPNHLYLILDKMVEVYKNKKMFKFLHIPIQSASNKVLKDMKRKYNIKVVEEIIERFRGEFPNVVLATDIITGYPSEGDKEHIKNLEFIKEFKPDVLNLSKFSSHKGTKAGEMKELPIEVINKRTTELMEAHRKTAYENKEKYLNEEMEVFVDKKVGEGLYESRDGNYNIVLINTKENILGQKIEVKIKRIGVHHMIGEILTTSLF